MSYKSVSECATRGANKSVRQGCLTRISHKVVPQNYPTKFCHKSMPQECQAKVFHTIVQKKMFCKSGCFKGMEDLLFAFHCCVGTFPLREFLGHAFGFVVCIMFLYRAQIHIVPIRNGHSHIHVGQRANPN